MDAGRVYRGDGAIRRKRCEAKRSPEWRVVRQDMAATPESGALNFVRGVAGGRRDRHEHQATAHMMLMCQKLALDHEIPWNAISCVVPIRGVKSSWVIKE